MHIILWTFQYLSLLVMCPLHLKLRQRVVFGIEQRAQCGLIVASPETASDINIREGMSNYSMP